LVDDGRARVSELTDEELTARVAQRDVAAFSSLYDRYARIVYVLAAHTLGQVDAEEVVQEVFLRLWSKAGQFDPERGSFRGWFLAVARHFVLGRLHQRDHLQRLLAVGEIESLLAEAVDPALAPDEAADHREYSKAILRALEGLPPDQRRVLVLTYFGGFSQSSLAQQLGWPLGTVKKRIRLGLQKLRATLGEAETSVPAAAKTRIGAE